MDSTIHPLHKYLSNIMARDAKIKKQTNTHLHPCDPTNRNLKRVINFYIKIYEGC